MHARRVRGLTNADRFRAYRNEHSIRKTRRGRTRHYDRVNHVCDSGLIAAQFRRRRHRSSYHASTIIVIVTTELCCELKKVHSNDRSDVVLFVVFTLHDRIIQLLLQLLRV